LVGVVRATMTRAEFAARHGLDATRPIVTLLPGSRRSEIVQHYGRVLEACERLKRTMYARGIQFVHAVAPNLKPELFAPYGRAGLDVKKIEGATYDALAAADCAIVASGTATVEAALLGTPMVVIYRVAPITAAILRHMIRTPFIGMVNLIAGRRVATELIQDTLTPETLKAEVRRLLESEAARAEAKAGLAEVRAKMGPAGAIERTADIFARML
jgi:lipid-A-disaccharide synthase